MLNSTVSRIGARYAAIARTSAAVMWRSSARGCTVMPRLPAPTMTRTASITDGTDPPREFRRVATLLTLTLSLAGMSQARQPRCSFTVPAISVAQAWISF
jgi:hypothetical protein